KMRFWQFLQFDVIGAGLYASAYILLGFVFRDFLARILSGFSTAGRVAEISFAVAITGYILYRIWLYKEQRIFQVVPRIQVEEFARQLATEEKGRILLVDVRSHGYYDSNASRIQGSIRLEPNNLEDQLKDFPRDKHIYLYCT